MNIIKIIVKFIKLRSFSKDPFLGESAFPANPFVQTLLFGLRGGRSNRPKFSEMYRPCQSGSTILPSTEDKNREPRTAMTV